MSDIQELIHKTSMDCIEKGQAMERERIIKLLEERKAEIMNKQDADDLAMDLWVDGIVIRSIDYEIELIKGETNE